MNRRYARGTDFPNEGFVQAAIEAHVRKLGFEILSGGDADLVAFDPTTGKRWIIEAKGDTSDPGLDFRTGIGQLLQRMEDPGATYAIAVPEIPKFIRLCDAIPRRVRELLGIHWLLVRETGETRVVLPSAERCSSP